MTLHHTQGAEGEGIDATALPSGAFHALVNDPFGATVYLGHYDLTADGSAVSPGSPSSSSAPSAASSPNVVAASGGSSHWPTAAGLFGAAALAWRLRRRHSLA